MAEGRPTVLRNLLAKCFCPPLPSGAGGADGRSPHSATAHELSPISGVISLFFFFFLNTDECISINRILQSVGEEVDLDSTICCFSITRVGPHNTRWSP